MFTSSSGELILLPKEGQKVANKVYALVISERADERGKQAGYNIEVVRWHIVRNQKPQQQLFQLIGIPWCFAEDKEKLVKLIQTSAQQVVWTQEHDTIQVGEDSILPIMMLVRNFAPHQPPESRPQWQKFWFTYSTPLGKKTTKYFCQTHSHRTDGVSLEIIKLFITDSLIQQLPSIFNAQISPPIQ